MATNQQGACCLCVVEARGLGRKEKAEHPRGGTFAHRRLARLCGLGSYLYLHCLILVNS